MLAGKIPRGLNLTGVLSAPLAPSTLKNLLAIYIHCHGLLSLGDLSLNPRNYGLSDISVKGNRYTGNYNRIYHLIIYYETQY